MTLNDPSLDIRVAPLFDAESQKRYEIAT